VESDFARPRLELRRRRQFAEQDQVRGLDEIALFGELFDRVPAIEQDPFVAIDERDRAAAAVFMNAGSYVINPKSSAPALIWRRSIARIVPS
jgi:hypothetical protein